MAAIFHTDLPAASTLTLQQCGHCQQVNYPPRELCGHCLADELHWQPVPDTGIVQSVTELQYSLEPVYSDHLPWTIASIKLDCGPVVLAHLPPGTACDRPVRVKIIEDADGNRMLLAEATEDKDQQAASAWLAKVQFKEIC